VSGLERRLHLPADYMRRMGPFEPHRLPMDEMEYTTMPKLMGKLKDQWEDVK